MLAEMGRPAAYRPGSPAELDRQPQGFYSAAVRLLKLDNHFAIPEQRMLEHLLKLQYSGAADIETLQMLLPLCGASGTKNRAQFGDDLGTPALVELQIR